MRISGADLTELRRLVTQLNGPYTRDLGDALDKMNENVQASSIYWTGEHASGFRDDFATFTLGVRRHLSDVLAQAARVTGQNLTAVAVATGEEGGVFAQPENALYTTLPASGGSLGPAQQDAALLAQGEQSGNIAEIQSVQTDIQNHIDTKDTAWLQDFYTEAGPQVADLAQTLHNLDAGSAAQPGQDRFTVLTSFDEAVLSTYANGLAIADKAGLPPQAIQAITTSPSIWSAAMLVKFGPPGSQWATSEQKTPGNEDGLSLLAQMTNAVYAAGKNGTLQIPVGDGNRLLQRIGDDTQLQDAIANFEPLTPLLQRDAENKNASWQVLGGQDGAGIAQQLLHDGVVAGGGNITYGFSDMPGKDGKYPAYVTAMPASAVPSGDELIFNTVPDSVAGQFLDAATSVPRGNSADANYAAQAAVNIIDNTSKPWFDGGNPQTSYGPQVEKALLDTAQRYMLDLGRSSFYTGGSIAAPFANGPKEPYGILVNGAQAGSSDPFGDSSLQSFLQQICADPKAAGILKASTLTSLSNYYALSVKGDLPPELANEKPDVDMARLLGRVNIAFDEDKIQGQEATDAQHAEDNAMIKFGEDSAKFLPVVGDTVDKFKDPAFDLADLMGITTQFSTDNAAIESQKDWRNYYLDTALLHVPMVQGLINAHVISTTDPSTGKPYPFISNGQIVLTQDNQGLFENWYQSIKGAYHLDDWERNYGSDMTKEGLIASFDQELTDGGGS